MQSEDRTAGFVPEHAVAIATELSRTIRIKHVAAGFYSPQRDGFLRGTNMPRIRHAVGKAFAYFVDPQRVAWGIDSYKRTRQRFFKEYRDYQDLIVHDAAHVWLHKDADQPVPLFLQPHPPEEDAHQRKERETEEERLVRELIYQKGLEGFVADMEALPSFLEKKTEQIASTR